MRRSKVEYVATPLIRKVRLLDIPRAKIEIVSKNSKGEIS